MGKFKDGVLGYFGLTPGRRAAPARFDAIADGLLITATKTEAWFVISTSNTDLATEADSEDELTTVIRTVGKVIQDKDCHLKVVWSRVSGAEYVEEASEFYSAGNWEAYAAERAENIDAMNLPDRYLLLGVTIVPDRDKHTSAAVKGSVSDAIGLDSRHVSAQELRYSLGLAQQIGRTLKNSPWRANLAPAELIAWSIGREQRRQTTAVPRHGTITGANLATLTASRVVPYSDHLRIYDGRGEVVAYTAVLTLSDFPDELEVPGEGEWLRTLSDISRIDEHGEDVDVIADASVRFRVLSRAASIKRAEDARQLAKEQRKSAAKHSTGETSEEIEEAEGVAAGVAKAVRKDGLFLVESHPRIVLAASSKIELDANVDAVIGHYAGIGITAVVSADEQRDLWLEMLPGETLRVTDLGHIQEDVAFFGSWFWGGSDVGDDTGPVVGWKTGSTPGLVRNLVTSGAARGDATTTAFLGRSGRGKTTGVMLSLLDVGFSGGWATMLDFKTDAFGLVDAAKAFGLPSELVKISGEHAGAADIFRAGMGEDAPLMAARQLTLMAPRAFKGIAETATLAAANRAAGLNDPSTHAVIEDLRTDERAEVRELGEVLHNLALTPLGRAVAGQPTGASGLRSTPGIWVVQLPGLVMPGVEKNPDDWDASQRVSIAAMRGITAHALHMSSDPRVRSMAKAIAVPEVHRMIKTDDGKDFLDQTARMGRAFNTSLVLDSQDAEGLAAIEGVVEQLTAVFGFQLTSTKQQDALAELLHLPPGPSTRELIRGIGVGADREIRHGHCLYRDRREQTATFQWEYPSEDVRRMLNTNPDREEQAADVVLDGIEEEALV